MRSDSRRSDAASLRNAHRWIAFAFFALILLHLAAGLFPALVRRDGVFESMAPGAAGTLPVAGEQSPARRRAAARAQPARLACTGTAALKASRNAGSSFASMSSMTAKACAGGIGRR